MHRCVLLDRIAARYYDRHGNTNACSGKSQRLAVIATRCGGDPLHLRARSFQPVEIDDPAAHLERANRRVVLVLHHDLDTGALLEQRPGILRGRGYARAHQRNYAFKLRKGEHPGLSRCLVAQSSQLHALFKAAAIDQRAVSTGKKRGTLLTEAISGWNYSF